MKIFEWVIDATKELAGAGIGTAKLDAELILAHTIRKGRTWIHAYRDDELSPHQQEIADARIALRVSRVPLAYITGHKEFYGRRFDVTPSTLIPRPESEAIIEMLKELLPSTTARPGFSKRLIDIGTGSGCLGITAKLEFPELDVTLADTSRYALKVAEKNATRLQAPVDILRSDLLKSYVMMPDIILANLPYVDTDWERSPETNHEPAEALFADNNGMKLIVELLDQTKSRLRSGGIVILEADPVQHDTIIVRAKTCQLEHVATQDYAIAFRKL